jgi:hypothetical protein
VLVAKEKDMSEQQPLSPSEPEGERILGVRDTSPAFNQVSRDALGRSVYRAEWGRLIDGAVGYRLMRGPPKRAHLQELGALAEKKAARFWTINRTLAQGFLFAVTGQPSNAVEMITSGIAALRATGYTRLIPWWLSHLAVSHVDLDQLDDAQRCIGEALDAIEKTKERWCEAEACGSVASHCLR